MLISTMMFPIMLCLKRMKPTRLFADTCLSNQSSGVGKILYWGIGAAGRTNLIIFYLTSFAIQKIILFALSYNFLFSVEEAVRSFIKELLRISQNLD